jgi:hypothetical protein
VRRTALGSVNYWADPMEFILTAIFYWVIGPILYDRLGSNSELPLHWAFKPGIPSVPANIAFESACETDPVMRMTLAR